MKRMLAAFVAIAALTHVAGVAALPWLINAAATHKIAAAAGGTNVAIHAPRADATARTIVRPSPDLLYTACVFDVRVRPLHVTAPIADSYVSVAGFASDTTNFFAIDDAQLIADAGGGKHIDVIVASRGRAPAASAGARVIEAPSDRGLILFRSLIGEDAGLPRLRQLQAQQTCEPL